MKKAVAYYRVSTARQGQSGLGLEAQQKAIQAFISTHGFALLGEFTEVESGDRDSRPVLAQGLIICRKTDAVLLIACLDRLARNVVFIATLLQSKIQFIAVDNPHANKFMTHIMAAVSEYEREAISVRTKLALQAAKERGVELGKHCKYVLSRENKKAADDFALKMKPVLNELKNEGNTTIRKLCGELNKRNIATFRGEGFQWHVQTVHSVLARIKILNEQVIK